MNRRIEFLYDREHTLGHAFFLNIGTIGELKAVFENKIIPLLQEYFYEDYEKIQAVLNDTQQIYIVQVNDESDLFSNVFNELKIDNSDMKFKVANGVSDDDFIRFTMNITKVGD
jgi:5-methylcytosine-specific restriction protein B